jgi:hypothetical protein
MSETINDWENPHVSQRNREPAHVTLMPFADVASALAGDRLASPFFHLLNSDWRFTCAPRPEAVPADFHLPGYDAGAWDDLPVPSGGRCTATPTALRPRLWSTFAPARRPAGEPWAVPAGV